MFVISMILDTPVRDGAHIAQVIDLLLSKMQSNWHVIEMEYVFLNILLIVIQLYYENMLKDIYELHHLAVLNIQTHGIHSAQNIKEKTMSRNSIKISWITI